MEFYQFGKKKEGVRLVSNVCSTYETPPFQGSPFFLRSAYNPTDISLISKCHDSCRWSTNVKNGSPSNRMWEFGPTVTGLGWLTL